MNRLLVIAALVTPLGPTVVHADGAKPASIDWARGLVIADGIGVADRHAPNPAVARGTSRRGAEAVAKAKIAAELPKLPLATGGTVADRLKAPETRAAIDRAVAAAITLDAEPETDGAWRVTMAVPIEAVNQAIAGPRELPAAGDSGPPVVVIEAAAKPGIGWTIAGFAAAAIWVADVPAWAKDAPHAKAKVTGGTIALDKTGATAATLFVILSH